MQTPIRRTVLGTLIVAMAAGGCREQPPADAKKPLSKITISRETTYLTEPLRPDGYVDYLAAVNRQSSKGVTPENNAAVLLWQAFNSKGIRTRKEFFAAMGVPPPPLDGQYYAMEMDFIHEKEKRLGDASAPKTDVFGDFTRAESRPWSRDGLPSVAEWLERNRAPMQLISEASKRPRYYSPLVADGEPPLMSAFVSTVRPSLGPIHDAARAFLTRAMQRLQAGQIDEAWEDLMACHRLARLLDQGPGLVDGLVAINIECWACNGDEGLANSGRIPADRIRRMDADLAQLTPLAPVADRIQRLEHLNNTAAIARSGLSSINFSDEEREELRGMFGNAIADRAIDWNETFRVGNQWYDRVVAAQRRPTAAERVAAGAAIDKEARALASSAKPPGNIITRFFCGESRKALGRRFGEALVSMWLGWVENASTAVEQTHVRQSLSHVAMALAIYRAEHGAYPASLDALKPKCLAELPKDPWSGKDFLYKPQKDGYVLYSVGPNGKDDGGRDASDRDPSNPAPQGWDDIAIRVPPKR